MDFGEIAIVSMIVAMFVLFMGVLGGVNLYVMISDMREARRHEKHAAAHKQHEPQRALAA